jgi:hypothetical protein
MLQAFATPHNRTVSVLLLVACGLLAVAAATLGIIDNLPGIVLAFLSIAAFVTVLVHPWRSPRRFWILAGGSLAAFAVLVLLCALFVILAKKCGPGGVLFGVLDALSGVCMVAAGVCPSPFMVGVVGGLVMLARERHRTKTAA